MKCIFIYNPNSGRGKIAKKLSYIKKKLAKKYDTVDVYATKAKGDLTLKVREVADEYDCIVFSGGDGTFNEVLRGLGDREKLPLLGYIPGGTANDIAHSLGIPRKNLRGALKVILKGRRELLDCMRINGTHYAMYSVSAGAFTSATYNTPQEAKKALGIIAYGVEGLRKNLPFQVFRVRQTADGRTSECDCVFTLVLNSKCVAGQKMNPKGSMCDGIVESVIVKQAPRPNFWRQIRAFFTLIHLFIFGYTSADLVNDLVRFSGKKFRLEVGQDVVWNYDGEKGDSGSIKIEVLEKHVPLLVPKKSKNI